MGHMNRLDMAHENGERWVVLPSLQKAERHHTYAGSYRLMENMGKGRWIQREQGDLRPLQKKATEYNKTGYETPLSEKDRGEVARFSVMERVRIGFQ